jgi:hypothetical protein
MTAAKLKSTKIKRAQSGFAVDRHAAQHARYDRTSVYIPQSENNDNGGWYHVSRNRDINLLDAWITQENGFDGRHLRNAYRCRYMWECIPRPSMKAQDTEGRSHAKAATNLLKLKRSVPRADWEVFENAMRWNEPGGYIGSRFLSPSENRVKETQEIVKRVLQSI